MRALFLLIVVSIAAPIREPARPIEVPKKPQDLIFGDWFYENRAIGQVTNANKPNLGIRFLPGETVFMVNNNPSAADGLTANVVIDWSQNPVTIDFMPKRGGNKMLGILKLEGDQMILAIRTNGGPRPTAFTGPDLLVGQCQRKR